MATPQPDHVPRLAWARHLCPSNVFLLCTIPLLAAATAGCGEGAAGAVDPDPDDAVGPACAERAALEDPAEAVEEPIGDEESCMYFLAAPEEAPPDEPWALSAVRAPLVYLNRNGGTYVPGPNDARQDSSSVVDHPVRIEPHAFDEQTWARVVGCVRDRFARFDVDVVDEDPGDLPHVEAVLGGHPCQMGFSRRVRGVAPVARNCSFLSQAVVFVFADNIDDPRTLCEVTAHEVGHAAGLEHEYLCEDPMTYLRGCGEKSFQDVSSRCGTTEPRDCVCGPTQNTVAHLFDTFGPRPGADLEAPAVEILSPTESTFPAHSQVTVEVHVEDDSQVSAIKLQWHNGGAWLTLDCDDPPSNVSCERDGDRARFHLFVGEGERRLRARASDRSGNVGVTKMRQLYFEASPAGPQGPGPTRAPTSRSAG